MRSKHTNESFYNPSRRYSFNEHTVTVGNYTIGASIIKPSEISMNAIKERYSTELKIIGFELIDTIGKVFMTSLNNDEISVVDVDIEKLYREAIEARDEYKAAVEVIVAKSVHQPSDELFRIEALTSHSDSEWVLYYLSDNKSFYVVDYTPVRVAKNELLKRMRSVYCFMYPTTNEKVRLEPDFKERFVSGIKFQKNNVKVTCSDGLIKRYDTDTWIKSLREDVGRTPGTTIGGIVRRMRSGKYNPDAVMLYVYEKDDVRFGLMSIKTGKKIGESFFVPPQSIDMYVDLIVDKYTEDSIVRLSK